MKIHLMMAFIAFFPGTLGHYRGGEEIIQGSTRAWGQPTLGLRCSISVEKMPVLKGSPFAVSMIIENISGTRVDLKTITAFHLVNSSKTSPESTLQFGGYWCPINLADTNPAGKSGPILATQSQVVLEKGTSLRATMDLARHGWEKSTSSWWPAREFDSAVVPGKYVLRLDIQVGSGTDPKWIRSNEIDVVIRK
jgi:hypothetical protein